MQTLKKIIEQTWEKILVLIGTLFVLLPISPLNMQYTFRDSGVFLYFGWRILNGELPYRDIWDHKPPMIFYLNALGLAASNNSRWGVWLIEFVFLFLAAFIGYQLIKKFFGVFPAMFSLLLLLLSLTPLLQGGNFTTEYALVFQFSALWLVYHSEKSHRPFINFYFIGFIGAVSFFTKQTTIGVWLAITIYLTIRRFLNKEFGRWARDLFSILLGGLTVAAFWAIFFGVQGSFPHFWNEAFEYNFVYSSYGPNGFLVRVDAVLQGLKPLLRTRMLPIALIGCAGVFMYFFVRRDNVEKAMPLLLIAVINFPIELILIGTPRQTYPPYYITALPALTIFSGMAFWILFELLSRWKLTIIKYAVAIAVAGFLVWSSFYNYMGQVYTYRKLTKQEDIVNYIKENTQPDNTVLIWGAETSINYFSGRKSPTRYVYQYPLFKDGYTSEFILNEFLDELLKNRPELVIDTGSQDPFWGFPITTAEISEKTDYLKNHYCEVQQIDDWIVYRYSQSACAP